MYNPPLLFKIVFLDVLFPAKVERATATPAPLFNPATP